MLIYNTSSVAEKHRFEFWHEVICRHFVPASSQYENRAAFNARFQTAALGPVHISRLTAPRHAWSRKQVHVRRAPHEEFLLSLPLAAGSCLGQSERQLLQRPGEMAFYDTAQPFSYLLESDLILVKIPRHEMLTRLSAPGRLTATGFGLATAVGRLAAGLIQQSLDLDLSANPAAAGKIGSSLLDATAAAIELELLGGADTRPRQAIRLEQIKQYVAARLADRGLSAESIAARHNVSARTLNRLFALEGTTPMRWVWETRLQACHRQLSAARPGRVTDVALACGFSDLSHFCRAFKAHFGVSPGAVAKRH